MLGADIYRYQTITDWPALARKVTFLWVKGTDGARRAPSPADDRVRQARAHDIPVGLYHYAQLVPRPEAQADVLAAEVRRLRADQVAPALDLEHPHQPGPAAREFALRFLRRLVDKHRFPRVAIYGNATMFAAIRPDTWDIPGLVIWCAHYGPNDGERHNTFRPYTGRVDVHQYTDRGSLPGIANAVDLNHAIRSPLLEDDVSYDDALRAIRDYMTEKRRNPNGAGTPTTLEAQLLHGDYRHDRLAAQLVGLRTAVTTMAEALAGTRPDLTPEQLQQAVETAMHNALATGAVDVNLDVTVGGRVLPGEGEDR